MALLPINRLLVVLVAIDHLVQTIKETSQEEEDAATMPPFTVRCMTRIRESLVAQRSKILRIRGSGEQSLTRHHSQSEKFCLMTDLIHALSALGGGL